MAFADLDRQIQRQMTKIRDLKLRIMSTNVSTILENGISLQEAIVRLGDVRSELHSHNQLLDLQPNDRGSWFGSDRSPRVRLPQIERPVLLDRIETLEAQKYHLDALIAKANNTVDLGVGEEASPGRRR